MALIKCPECNKEISDTAKRCPNCGYNFSIEIKKKIRIIIFVFLVCVVLLFGFIIYQHSKPIYKYSNQAVVILKDYQNAKISNYEAAKKIKDIHNLLNDDDDFNTRLLKTDLYLLSIKLDDNRLNYSEISNYIKELKKY